MSGRRQEGIYMGVAVFVSKLAQAVVLALLPVALRWSGYVQPTAQNPTPSQPAAALNALRLLIAILPALLLVARRWVAGRYSELDRIMGALICLLIAWIVGSILLYAFEHDLNDNFSDIMAHELAHQWWGDEVTCQTWYDIWLNEGFASYSESLYRELKPHNVGVSVLCPMLVDTKIYENSARMRPDHLRNEQETPIPEGAGLAGGTIPAEDVARRVVRAIERRDLYILTHPEQREILRRRAALIDRMFEEDLW